MELTDLTDTNPTRHGLFDPTVLEVVARQLPRAGRYEPSPRGPWPARAGLAERYGGSPDDYWLTASTSEAYGWLFCLLADPGEAVAIPSPGYPLIEPLARFHGLATRSYRTFYVHPAGWELDRDHLDSVLSDRDVRAVVAVNPNNPTGGYADAAVRGQAAERGLPLIADEVFFPFQLDHPSGGQSGTVADVLSSEPSTATAYCPRTETLVSPIERFESVGTVPADSFESVGTVPADSPADSHAVSALVRLSGDDSTLTFGLDGLSKLLAAPQLKLGWIRLSGPEPYKDRTAQALDQIADAHLSVNTPVALALPELLTLADDSITRITNRLRANLALARTIFTNLRIRTTHGGWMMLLDVPPIMEADALVVSLMDRAGLYVHPGYFYDLPDSTLAISLLPDSGVFEESARRLSAALTVFANEEPA